MAETRLWRAAWMSRSQSRTSRNKGVPTCGSSTGAEANAEADAGLPLLPASAPATAEEEEGLASGAEAVVMEEDADGDDEAHGGIDVSCCT